jgi:nitroreductase
MDLLTAIDTRSSALRLADPTPCQSHLERIPQSGVRVPDHGLLAPARFVVLRAEGLERLGNALAQALKSKNPGATPEQLEAERKKALRAPVVLVVAARPKREHKVPVVEQMSSVSAGVQNMFLTAHALGYGAMWKTGGAACDARSIRRWVCSLTIRSSPSSIAAPPSARGRSSRRPSTGSSAGLEP